MTIDKSKSVTLPVWVITSLLSLIISGFIVWGGMSSTKSTLELKAQINASNIETLRKEKVGKDEFSLVLDKLNSIEKKLDNHIEK